MKRREFIQSSSLAAVGMLTLPSFLMKKEKKGQIGLQLYTLRSTIGQDPKGVLKKVSEFGYKNLETYGYGDGKIFGMGFKEFNDYVKSLGMKVTSGHYGLDMIKGDKWKKAVDDAKANGQKFMVVPYINEDQRKTIDDYKRIIADLNAAGEVCNAAGIRFGYHNHAFEFDTVDGQIPYDVMLKELDPKNVGMEMDIFWVVNAGRDPLKYFEQYPGRFEQWHVKDMDKSDKNRNANIGSGTIDWKPIFAKAKQSGLKHFYVEQESYPGEPINSVEEGAKYLKTIL
ncbi:sugar phosphate isomerase/epimerase family protein [Pseudochryseolinea flava]|nr:sugar phosphate isomerase/epimerase [Pseudochryseolinea flava]